MDKKTVFIKTPKGESEMSSLSGDMKRVMLLIDDKSSLDAVTKHAPPSLRGDLPEIMQRLLDAELIQDKDKKISAPKITAPKVVATKAVTPQKAEELDFTSMVAAQSPSALAAEAAKQKARQDAEAKAKHEAEAARARAELEAAVAAAKLKASAEAEAKAQAIARQEAEIAARAKAEADARAKHEAAERQVAELKAKQEAEARMRAEQEAARVKAELEAAAKAKAEAEAARIKAEQEVARIKAEQEVARIKAEQEAARIKAEQEAARIKAEQETARIKAEQEAARIKAELEATRARAEAESKALAEERARQEIAAARLKAEQEAKRIKAEQESAHIQNDQDAALRAKVAAAERARNEEEAARNKGGQDEVARLAAEAEKMLADEKAQRDAQIAKQEVLAAAAKQETEIAASPFQINLDNLNLGTNQVAAQPVTTESERPAQPEPAVVANTQSEKEKRAAAEARAAAEQKSKLDAANEMSRLKAEQEASRLKSEQAARAKEEEKALAAEQADAWAEAEQRAKLQAKLDSAQASQQATLAQAKSAKQPSARARRKPLPLGKIFFTLIALALIVAVVLPYVWPLQEYIAPIEQRLTAQLKQTVHIGGMSAATFPPKLQLQNVTVGNAQEVKFGTVTLNFDPLTLFAESKAISNAELQNVTLDGKRIEQIAVWLKGLGGDVQFPVRHLTIQSLQLNVEGISLPPLKGSADLVQGAFTRIVMYSDDSKVHVELQPGQNAWQLSFGIKERALPLLPEVMFSDFSVKGEIADGEVNFTELDAHAYGGILSGTARLNWRKGWQLQGRIQAKTMELEKLFPQFGLAGEVFADGTFSAQSAKLAQLGDLPRLDGSFEAKKGVINGIDMVETARLSSHEHLAGGRTHFDELTGAIQLENHNRHFRQIKITSGMLSASGSFDVTANNQLSGSFNSEIKMRGGNNPLVLSGTLTEPKLVAR